MIDEVRKDWFDFADKDAIRAEYFAGPQDLDQIAPGQWGIRGVGVICVGDEAHMRKVAAKLFRDKFHAEPCPLGKYGPGFGGPALPSVAQRLGVTP